PGNTGEVLAGAMALGAQVDLLDEAWWNPAPRQELLGSILLLARQLPGAIYVDTNGRRFVNEANSYVEVCNAMYAAHAMPCWLVCADGFRRRYPMALPGRSLRKAIPGRLPKEWIDNGWVRRSDSIDGLAGAIGVEPSALASTISDFNVHAAEGRDPDFQRGAS